MQTPSSPGLPYVHSIQAVGERDQGMYTCVARNVVGRSHAAAYLQVNNAIKTRMSRLVKTVLMESPSFLGCWSTFITFMVAYYIILQPYSLSSFTYLERENYNEENKIYKTISWRSEMSI